MVEIVGELFSMENNYPLEYAAEIDDIAYTLFYPCIKPPASQTFSFLYGSLQSQHSSYVVSMVMNL